MKSSINLYRKKFYVHIGLQYTKLSVSLYNNFIFYLHFVCKNVTEYWYISIIKMYYLKVLRR